MVSTHVKAKLRWLAKVFSIFIVVFISVVALITTLVWQSETVRVKTLNIAISFASRKDDIALHADGISSPSFSVYQVNKITIVSKKSPKITITDAKIEWTPKALFQRRIYINTLHADTISVERNGTTPDVASSQNPGSPHLKLPKITVDALSIKKIFLLDYFTNIDNEIIFDIKGNLDIKNEMDISSNIEMNQLKDGDTSLSLSINNNNASNIDIKGKLTESPQGIIGKLLKLPRDQNINAGFDFLISRLNDGYTVAIRDLTFPIFEHRYNIKGDVYLDGLDFFQGKTDYAFNIEGLTLKVDESLSSIAGNGSLDSLDLQISLQRFPLTTLSPFYPELKDGWISSTSSVSGSFQDPSFNGNIEAWANYKDTTFQLNFNGNASKNEVKAQSFTIKPQNGELKGKGSLVFNKAFLDIDVDANSIDLRAFDSFYTYLPKDINGRIKNLKGRLSGPLKNPNGSLSGVVDLNFNEHSFLITTKLNKNKSAIKIENLSAKTTIGNINATGIAHLDEKVSDIHFQANNLDVKNLQSFNIPIPSELSGKIDSSINIRGNLRSPDFLGEINFVGAFKDIPMSLTASAEKTKNVQHLRNLTLMSNGEKILASRAEIKNNTISANFTSSKLPTALLSAFDLPVLPGEFISDISINGPLTDPIIQGSYTYSSKTFGYDKKGEKKDIKFKWDVDISTQEENYVFTSLFTRNSYAPGRMRVLLDKKPYFNFLNKPNRAIQDIPTQMEIEGNIDLQTISFLLDPELYRFVGQVQTELTLDGTLSSPNINGQLNITDARYENPLTGTVFTNTNCKINIKNQHFKVDTCEANNGSDGSFTLNGEVIPPTENDRGNIDLQIHVNNANIIRRKDIESEVRGNLILKGNFDRTLASGELEVSPLTLNIGARNTRTIPTIHVSEVKTTNQTSSKSYFPILDFDLSLFANNQAFIRGRGLDAELSGKVSLSGNTTSPKYDGKFETIRGVLKLFNKKFILQEGVITFANDAVSLNISAEYTKGEQRVKATLYGTNNDINIALSATPAMQEDEILAYIIFGKPLKDVTSIEAVQLASAVQTLRGDNSGFDPIESTRRVLGVDSFTIESANTEEGDLGVNIGVGKYLNENVYLELERTPNPSQPWKGRIEIELAPNINLESSTGGQSGIEGVELKWKKDY